MPSMLALVLQVAHHTHLLHIQLVVVPLAYTLNVLRYDQCHFPLARQIHGNYIKVRNRLAQRIEATSHLRQASLTNLVATARPTCLNVLGCALSMQRSPSELTALNSYFCGHCSQQLVACKLCLGKWMKTRHSPRPSNILCAILLERILS